MLLLTYLTCAQNLSMHDAREFTSNARVRRLFLMTYNTIGCIPDNTTCPSWDCAASRSVNHACPRLSADIEDAFEHLNWKLCYDQGLTGFAFQTQVWLNSTSDGCCTASHFRKFDVEHVCAECEPCCTRCTRVDRFGTESDLPS